VGEPTKPAVQRTAPREPERRGALARCLESAGLLRTAPALAVLCIAAAPRSAVANLFGRAPRLTGCLHEGAGALPRSAASHPLPAERSRAGVCAACQGRCGSPAQPPRPPRRPGREAVSREGGASPGDGDAALPSTLGAERRGCAAREVEKRVADSSRAHRRGGAPRAESSCDGARAGRNRRRQRRACGR
jgi:hypothetical protein